MNNQEYLLKIRDNIIWAISDYKRKFIGLFLKDKIGIYKFDNKGIFSSKTIIEKIIYDIHKYFNSNFILNELNVDTLMFDKNDESDAILYEKLKELLIPILKEFNNLIFDRIININSIIEDLINNYKTFYFYKSFVMNELENQLFTQIFNIHNSLYGKLK